jgi:hypothetical protein
MLRKGATPQLRRIDFEEEDDRTKLRNGFRVGERRGIVRVGFSKPPLKPMYAVGSGVALAILVAGWFSGSYSCQCRFKSEPKIPVFR